jgi:hypothetical protein
MFQNISDKHCIITSKCIFSNVFLMIFSRKRKDFAFLFIEQKGLRLHASWEADYSLDYIETAKSTTVWSLLWKLLHVLSTTSF